MIVSTSVEHGASTGRGQELCTRVSGVCTALFHLYVWLARHNFEEVFLDARVPARGSGGPTSGRLSLAPGAVARLCNLSYEGDLRRMNVQRSLHENAKHQGPIGGDVDVTGPPDRGQSLGFINAAGMDPSIDAVPRLLMQQSKEEHPARGS